MLIGTIHSRESLGGTGRRLRYVIGFWSFILLLLGLGLYSCGEVFGWWNHLPWMVGESWSVRLLWGAIAALVTPIGLSAIWALLFGRWRFWLIAGLLLAVLLIPIITTAAISVLAWRAERIAKRFGLTSPNEPDLPAGAFADATTEGDER